MVTVTKRFTFEASHYLEHPEFSPRTNWLVYHACSGFKDSAVPDGVRAADCKDEREPHGHSYVLEVTVRGDAGDHGFIIDFKELKRIVNACIITKCDHRLLNKVSIFKGYPTSCENMIRIIADIVEKSLREHNAFISLYRLRLWETADSYAEWTAEER